MTTQDRVAAIIQQREADEKAELDAKIAKIRELQRPFREAEERKRQQAAEASKAEQLARQERTEKELEAEARQMFFSGTPGASEELYQKMREKLREQVLLSR